MYPESEKILQAVGGFLRGPASSAVSDRGMAFKLRLAASLVEMVGRELEHPTPSPNERSAELLRAATEAPIDEALVRRLRQALESELKVVAPHFDLRLDVEKPV